MNGQSRNYLNMKLVRTIVALFSVLLLSTCASAIIMEHTPRENDDRTELQIQLDRAISEKINAKFKHSDVVRSTALHISTYKHVVTLNGFVGTKKQKRTALRLALSVSGVKSIISDIGIRK